MSNATNDIIDAAPEPQQTHALAVQVTPGPRDLYRVATDVAGICREIVIKTSKRIGARDYVCVEGWMAIATAHGCMLSIDEVTENEGGDVIAIASVRRMSDGLSLARAEGFVGTDEKMWAGRQRYARRAMAQTRAMSRAARSAFAHVVVLIDANLATTPAEEMFGTEPDDAPAPPQRPQPRPASRQQPASASGKATAAQVTRVLELLPVAKGVTDELIDKWFRAAHVEAWDQMHAQDIAACIEWLEYRAPNGTKAA